MDIAYEEIKTMEEKLINKVLYFALEEKYKKQIDKAKEIFKENYNSETFSFSESYFIPWLLWDFKLSRGNNFFEEYIESKTSEEKDENINLLRSLSKARLSVYEILEKNKDNLKLNNILLNKEITIKNTLELNDIDINTLILIRVYNYEGANYFVDDYIIIDKIFRGVIERGFYEKYMEYQEKYGPIDKEKFIESNSILIYNFANIIEELTNKELENENQFSVYQSTYLILNFSQVKSKLLSYQNAELDYEEDGNIYLRIYDDNEKILCEIVLNKARLEVECTSDIDRMKAKKLVENMIGTYIKHFKDEVLNLDDVL